MQTPGSTVDTRNHYPLLKYLSFRFFEEERTACPEGRDKGRSRAKLWRHPST